MDVKKGSIEVAEQVIDVFPNGKDSTPYKLVFSFTLKYTITGRYLHATYWHPEEFPDVEFDNVVSGETQLLTFNENLDMKYLDDVFTAECMHSINKWVEDNYSQMVDRVFEKEGDDE